MSYLKQLGAGFPDEWTNPWFYSKFEAGDFDALCRFVGSRDVDGFTGLRVTWRGMMQLCRIYDVKASEFFDKALPDAKFIYFERDNLAQALESVYYEQMQMFDDVPSYLPSQRIEEMLVEYAVDGSAWEMFFSEYGVDPLRMMYEDLLKNRNMECNRVLQLLGLPVSDEKFLSNYKTFDGVTDVEEVNEWYKRFMNRYEKIIKGA